MTIPNSARDIATHERLPGTWTAEQLAEAVASIRGWLEANRDLFAGAEERRERFAEAARTFRRDRSEPSRLALLAEAKDYYGEWSQAYRQVIELTETPAA